MVKNQNENVSLINKLLKNENEERPKLTLEMMRENF
jgi:hypothetical protein